MRASRRSTPSQKGGDGAVSKGRQITSFQLGRKSMSSRFVVLFVSIFSIAVPIGAIGANSDASAPTANVANGYALVIFNQAPLAEWPNAARQKNGKLDFTSGANGQYQASLAHARNDFKPWL